MTKPQTIRLSPYHSFLKRLRAKGRSNMYGAIPYLMNSFGVDREHAFRIVCDWLDSQAVHPAAAERETVRRG
jgi:hypothetical protein